MNLYIVRHGQTLFNYLERVQGWSDSPLTELGINQAEAVGKYLKNVSFERIYSSDLKRAVDTAKYISKQQNNKVHIKETRLLREAYYGGFEGGTEEGPWKPVFTKYGYPTEKILTDFSNTLKQVLKEIPNTKIRNIIAETDPLGLAENYDQYFKRLNEFAASLTDEKQGDNVLIVCHGGTAQLLLEILLENSNEITEPDNCSTSIIKIDQNQNKLIDFNNTSYL